MISIQEYFKAYHNYPFYAEPYDGIEEDKEKIRQYNKELIEKYPWLMPRNVWTGEIEEDFNYEFSWWDSIPDGWRLAFGDKLAEEIQQALLHAQELDPEGGYKESYITTNYDSDRIIPYVEGFRIETCKEKWGSLRIYTGSAPKEVLDIINKYEQLSWNYCIICGKPSKWHTVNYIEPFCDSCRKELEESGEIYDMFEPIKKDEN